MLSLAFDTANLTTVGTTVAPPTDITDASVAPPHSVTFTNTTVLVYAAPSGGYLEGVHGWMHRRARSSGRFFLLFLAVFTDSVIATGARAAVPGAVVTAAPPPQALC
mmetsp:Transcript_13285/g.27115  ORF Transcript_13285/g.27115 Transcript_13285/m.27115 type:complete len:107 (-) Transcript_13285:811-1131(-)